MYFEVAVWLTPPTTTICFPCGIRLSASPTSGTNDVVDTPTVHPDSYRTGPRRSGEGSAKDKRPRKKDPLPVAQFEMCWGKKVDFAHQT